MLPEQSGRIDRTLEWRKKMGWMWLLVLVLVIVAVIVKLRRNSHIFIIRHNPASHSQNERSRNDSSRATLASDYQTGEVERMVCCEYCEVYIPVSEAIERSGKIFCCREHSVAYFSQKQSS